MEQFVEQFEWLTLPAGEFLLKQGEASDSLYVLVTGKAQALIKQEDGHELVVGEIGVGEPIGEMEILTNDDYAASVRAVEDMELIQVPRWVFTQLARKHTEILQQMGQYVVQRMRRNQLTEVLYHIFGKQDEQSLKALEAEAEWVQLLSGEVLMHAGDSGTSMYLLISGRLQAVVPDPDGSERIVGDIHPGESVGEMELISGDSRLASVYACRDSTLVKLSRQSCFRLVQKRPELMGPIVQNIADRLRQKNQGITAHALSNKTLGIALVPASPRVNLIEFAQRLSRALMGRGGSLLLNSEIVDSLMGTPGISNAPVDDPQSVRLVVWLNGQEHRHRFLLYVADSTATGWSKRCIRQADHILLVGEAGDDPRPEPIESELLLNRDRPIRVPQSLILLHPPSTEQPLGTNAWLTPRQVKMHHHIRRDRAADMERLVRFLVGEAVGLVLGGGAARGFAHMGVIRALEELGIPVDIVGGTSVGSIIAAAYAFGWNYETMMEVIPQSTKKGFSGLTVPLVSVMSGKNMDDVITQFASGIYIEDLWRSYYCVSCNLTRAEVVVHRTGPLQFGLRASTRVPGILPPMNHNGDLLVDGGLLDNVPMDIMRDLCGDGTVIAVDVTPSISPDMMVSSQSDDSISGWRMIRDKLNPFAGRGNTPGIAAVLRRSVELGCVYTIQKSVRRNIADLYLVPPLGQFPVTNFEYAEDIAGVGYQFAKEKLSEWQRK
ncbi:MAG: patatin-like phospholipase domain-containing protein [Proteobacteria bacterium]|nr:patatin-like phospholipase domain-containing protein [Pseudomonadota bacterium]